MKRQLQYTSQKITTRLQRSLTRHLGSCSYVKRLLQYSQLKKQNNHAIFRSLPLRSHAHLSSSHYSSTLARTTLGGTLLLLSLHLASCFSSLLLLLGMSASLMPCFLACMYTLHACSASCFHYRTCFPTVHVHFSSRASWLHALTSYHTLHHCSVPVQRTSRQSELCRGLATSAQHPLPVMLAMHMLYKLSYRIRE